MPKPEQLETAPWNRVTAGGVDLAAHPAAKDHPARVSPFVASPASPPASPAEHALERAARCQQTADTFWCQKHIFERVRQPIGTDAAHPYEAIAVYLTLCSYLADSQSSEAAVTRVSDLRKLLAMGDGRCRAVLAGLEQRGLVRTRMSDTCIAFQLLDHSAGRRRGADQPQPRRRIAGNFFWLDRRVLDHGAVIGATGLAAYAVLADYANSKSRCFPSVHTLEREAGLSSGYGRDVLRKLEEARLIHIDRPTATVRHSRYLLYDLQSG